MKSFFQGDILKVEGIRGDVLVTSKNRFNQTGLAVVCPVLYDVDDAALHIRVQGKEKCGVAICEQLKTLDLNARGFSKLDEVVLSDVMEVSDAIQGIFDYIF